MNQSVLIFLPDVSHASAIKSILSLQGVVADVVSNSHEAVEAVSKNKYKALITDLVQRQKFEFVKFINSVQSIDSNLVLIFFTGAPEPRVVGLENNMIPRTAAYIISSRPSALNLLRDAIVNSGRSRMNSELRQHLTAKHALERLSRSQLHVLRCLVEGKSNAEIATIRGTTVRAVENLNRRTLNSLGIDHESSAAARGLAVIAYLEAIGRAVPNLHL